MKVILFGASGMVGQGVLRECLLDPGVEAVRTVGRNPLSAALIWPDLDARERSKLRQTIRKDLMDLTPVEADLMGYDACFYCLGVSAAGMTEEAYRRVTYDLAVSAGETLARLNPGMVFVYVSGAGTDASGKGRTMWARIKGQTENALMQLPFKRAYMFRPGGIVPLHGIVSKTKAYRMAYAAAKPILPLMRKTFPQYLTTTEQLGDAMLRVTREGYPTQVLEARDICSL